jgi:hypothetical protein
LRRWALLQLYLLLVFFAELELAAGDKYAVLLMLWFCARKASPTCRGYVA